MYTIFKRQKPDNEKPDKKSSEEKADITMPKDSGEAVSIGDKFKLLGKKSMADESKVEDCEGIYGTFGKR